MARTEARIQTTIWSDPDFMALSHGAQWMYHLILEQPELSLCGVVAITVGRWSTRSTSTTPSDIRAFLDELAEHRYIVVDETTEEVWVRSFILHDGVLKSSNSLIGMTRDYPGIHSSFIRKGVMEGLVSGAKRTIEGLIEGDPPDKPRVPKGFVEGFTHACARVPLPTPLPLSDSPPDSDVEIFSLKRVGVAGDFEFSGQAAGERK